MNRQELERLQASLDFHNARAILEDAKHRLDIRRELENQNRINILRAWAGDFTGEFNGQ